MKSGKATSPRNHSFEKNAAEILHDHAIDSSGQLGTGNDSGKTARFLDLLDQKKARNLICILVELTQISALTLPVTPRNLLNSTL